LGFAAGLHPATHPYYADLLRGAQAAARDAHMELLLLHENSVVHAERMDGVILAGAQLSMPQAMPCVAVMTSAGTTSGVVSDDYGGMTLAVRHLLELGHRRIAFLTDALTEEAGPLSLRRLRAYEDTMSRAGIEVGRQWVRCLFGKWEPFRSFDWAGHARITEWLHDGWRQLGCTALIAHNDEAALGAIRALAEAGIEVPAQVSVVGFDGIETIGMGGPTLTTVEVPLYVIGAEAVRRLLQQLQCAADGHPVRAFVEGLTQLPTALRPGASTAAPTRRTQLRPMPVKQGELS
jgi:LacI family transcriptional regulator